MSRATIVTRAIDVAALMAEVQSNDFGAVSVFAGTVRGVEAQTRDDKKGVSSTGVHRDPASGSTLGIAAQFLGWRRSIHPAD